MPQTMREEIDALLNGNSESVNDDETTEEIDESDTSTGEETEEEASGEEDNESETEEDTDTTEADSEDTDEIDAEALRKENEMLKLKLKLEGKAAEENKPVDIKELMVPKADDFDVFGGQEFNDIVEDKDSFANWAKELVKNVQEKTQEAIYKNLPTIMERYADETVTAKTAAEKFYRDNPVLAGHKPEMAKIANLIAQAEPGLSTEDFYNKVADYAYYTLKLEREVKSNEKSKSKPALKKGPSSRRGKLKAKPNLSALEKDIQAMLDSVA